MRNHTIESAIMHKDQAPKLFIKFSRLLQDAKARRWEIMKKLHIVLTLTTLFLVACGGMPTPDLEATVQAAVAATEAARPTETPTPKPTVTPEPTPTATPEPTVTPAPTDTPVPPTATPIPPTSTPTPPPATPMPVEGGGSYTDVNAAGLATMLESKDFLLVNVHIPYEGEIEGTDLFIPYNEIEQNLDKLPTDKGSKLVVYCRRGGKSAIAARMLVELGYTDVWNLDGGMIAWKEAGYLLMGKEG